MVVIKKFKLRKLALLLGIMLNIFGAWMCFDIYVFPSKELNYFPLPPGGWLKIDNWLAIDMAITIIVIGTFILAMLSRDVEK